MPDSRMIQKAGKITFLLVCLLLCTACGSKKAVFEAGKTAQSLEAQQKDTEENLDAKELDAKDLDTEDSDTEENPNIKEGSDGRAVSNEGLVNINTADEAELMTLSGIGQVRAAAIIEYRRSVGEFEKIEDIMNVKGIKTGIFKKISSYITVKDCE